MASTASGAFSVRVCRLLRQMPHGRPVAAALDHRHNPGVGLRHLHLERPLKDNQKNSTFTCSEHDEPFSQFIGDGSDPGGSFQDWEPNPDSSSSFRLKQIDFDGTFEYHAEVEVVVEMVERFLVEAVYPNPFNPEASFRFAVRQTQPVRVELYDMFGPGSFGAGRLLTKQRKTTN